MEAWMCNGMSIIGNLPMHAGTTALLPFPILPWRKRMAVLYAAFIHDLCNCNQLVDEENLFRCEWKQKDLWRRKTCSIRHHPQGESHKPVEQSWTIIIHVVLNQHLKWEHLEAFSNKANNKGNHCSIETEFCKEKIHHSGSAGIYNPYFSSKASFQLSHFWGVGGIFFSFFK